MHHWLVKTEPETYSIDSLQAEKVGRWDGVRNYQARNFLRDGMRVGEQVFIYHSSTQVPGIAGVGEVVRAGYPDPTAFDPESPYYDPASTPAHPRWYAVDIRFGEKFPEVMPLARLRTERSLRGMPLLRPGQRLSVQPVEEGQFEYIMKLVAHHG